MNPQNTTKAAERKAAISNFSIEIDDIAPPSPPKIFSSVNLSIPNPFGSPHDVLTNMGLISPIQKHQDLDPLQAIPTEKDLSSVVKKDVSPLLPPTEKLSIAQEMPPTAPKGFLDPIPDKETPFYEIIEWAHKYQMPNAPRQSVRVSQDTFDRLSTIRSNHGISRTISLSSLLHKVLPKPARPYLRMGSIDSLQYNEDKSKFTGGVQVMPQWLSRYKPQRAINRSFPISFVLDSYDTMKIQSLMDAGWTLTNIVEAACLNFLPASGVVFAKRRSR